MQRRDFLKALAGLSAAATRPFAFDRPAQQYRHYQRLPPCTTPLAEGKVVGWRSLSSVAIYSDAEVRIALVPSDCLEG